MILRAICMIALFSATSAQAAMLEYGKDDVAIRETEASVLQRNPNAFDEMDSYLGTFDVTKGATASAETPSTNIE